MFRVDSFENSVTFFWLGSVPISFGRGFMPLRNASRYRVRPLDLRVLRPRKAFIVEDGKNAAQQFPGAASRDPTQSFLSFGNPH